MYATLVDQAKRGDREAFDSLARLTGDRCMAIAFRILRDFDLADDGVIVRTCVNSAALLMLSRAWESGVPSGRCLGHRRSTPRWKRTMT